MKKLSGLIPPMVTPLDAKRRLDKVGVKKMVKHLLDGGVDGIFLLGTTGEGPHLSYAIRRELVKETCRLEGADWAFNFFKDWDTNFWDISAGYPVPNNL